MFRELKELIGEFLVEQSIDLDEGRAQQAWEATVGEMIKKNTEFHSLKKGFLTIKAVNPVWRNELSLRKIEIISGLNKELNSEIIKDIRFI